MALKKGQKVEIWSFDQKTYWGIGKYIGAERWNTKELGLGVLWIPKFKIGRKVYWGSGVWWHKLLNENLTNKRDKKQKVKGTKQMK